MGETIVLCAANEVVEGEIKQAPLPDGSKVAAVDTMSELWTGKPVSDLCPRINSLKLADGDGRVDTGAVVHVLLDAKSANGDPIKVTWELQRDMWTFQPTRNARR